MKTKASGAGAVRPPMPSGGLRERIELASSRIPWRVKLLVVYALIGVVLAVVFVIFQFDVEWMREHAWNIVRHGLPLTLLVCAGAIALATVLAALGSLARISRNPVAYGVAGFYTSFFRGTPLLVQIFLIYFGLAELGIRLQELGYGFGRVLILPIIPAGIAALGLNYGAYMTEIFRAGIQSVGHGQGEAADALGMSYRQKMWRIVLPQAVRVIIPPTGNEFIAMLKDSALVSTIGLLELLRRADLAGRADFRGFEAYLLAAAVYWVLTGIFSFFQSRLERRLSRGYIRAVEKRRPESQLAQPGLATEPVVTDAAEADHE